MKRNPEKVSIIMQHDHVNHSYAEL